MQLASSVRPDGYASSSVWLTFTPETTDPVTITTCSDSSTFDTQLALYRATDCGDFSTYELIGSNDDWCAGYRSTMYTSCLKWVQPITSKLMDGQAKPAMPMCRSYLEALIRLQMRRCATWRARWTRTRLRTASSWLM